MATAVKERPILFSGPMVRAILDGRKTVTRRVIKPQPEIGIPDQFIGWTAWNEEWSTHDARDSDPHVVDEWTCPYGYPGQRLWVREAWGDVSWTTVIGEPGPPRSEVVYKAGPHPFGRSQPHGWTEGVDKWKPSIHMPRRFSRLTLEIVSVRVERVQDISEADAKAEGFQSSRAYGPARDEFLNLWDKLNGPSGFGWNSNPYVWVVEFKRAE